MEENTLETSPTSKAMEKFRIDSLPNSTSASTVKITVKMVLIERVNVWRNALLTAFRNFFFRFETLHLHTNIPYPVGGDYRVINGITDNRQHRGNEG